MELTPIKQNPLHLLRIYIQAAKICCVFPIELKWTRNRFNIQKCSWERKLMCAMITFSCCFLEITRFLQYWKNNRPSLINPIGYFETARYFTTTLYSITTFTTIWFEFHRLQKAVDILQSNSNGLGNYYSPVFSRKYFPLIITWLISLLCFCFYSFIKVTLCAKQGFDLHPTFCSWREILFRQFFIDIIYPEASDIFRNCITILGIYMMFLAVLAYVFLDCLALIFTVILGIEINNCTEMMKSSLYNRPKYTGKITIHEIEQVLVRYKATLELSKAINDVIGVAVFSFTLEWIPYFIFVFLNFLNPPTVIGFFRQFYRLCAYFAFLFMAAALNNKCEDIEEWLRHPEVFSKLTYQQLGVLLEEAISKKIGIYGGWWFKISNKFVGSIVILFLTFSIIILQFKTSHGDGSQVECGHNTISSNFNDTEAG